MFVPFGVLIVLFLWNKKVVGVGVIAVRKIVELS